VWKSPHEVGGGGGGDTEGRSTYWQGEGLRSGEDLVELLAFCGPVFRRKDRSFSGEQIKGGLGKTLGRGTG